MKFQKCPAEELYNDSQCLSSVIEADNSRSICSFPPAMLYLVSFGN